ncbi:MAG: SOS response-associated peptidase family protein [Pseudomonadota bacterium]|nr:SOS response-associated peptidase family protein [Pseudomonadota bacterium]
MCNLYRMTKNADEVALWFDAVEAAQGANFASEVYPGYPGVVIAEGAVRRMNWGFPLQMKGKGGQPLKPRPVNNTRTDKLDSFFWRYSFEERRCLIPVTAWAEAEGAKGRKTRTWLSRPDAQLIAVAGIWRSSEEWGDVYSMVMTDSAGVAAECHDRMPVLLDKSDWAGWTDGSTEAARALCVPWTGALAIERTEDPWTKRA